MIEQHVERCIATLENWNDITIPAETMKTIIEGDEYLLEILDEYYPEPGDGLDTADRDVLHDAVARHVGRTHWPLNMDSEEDTLAMKQALIQHGFMEE